MFRRTLALCLIAVLSPVAALAQAAPPAPARPPAPPADTRLNRRFAVEIRAAPLGDVAAQLSRTLGVPLSVGLPLSDQRITGRAGEASLSEFMTALKNLFSRPWTPGVGEVAGSYSLDGSTALETAAARQVPERRRAILRRLQEVATAMNRPGADRFATELREQVTHARPELPAEAIAQLTPEYLRQAQLLAPLRGAYLDRLAQQGFVALPIRGLALPQQQTFLQFVAGTLLSGSSAPGEEVALAVTQVAYRQAYGLLSYPQARVEYRLVYGDAWSDVMVVIRVGYPDHWTTATLAGVLADPPDGRTYYPDASLAPEGDDLSRKLRAPVSLAGMNADEAFAALAKAADLRILADSYARPALFRPELDPTSLSGITVREALDLVSGAYGYFWWRQDGWILMRHRLWPEEVRVAVPDRLLRPVAANARQTGGFDDVALEFFASLGDEQLLALNMVGHSRGRPDAPLHAMDLNEIDRVQRGLHFSTALTPAQRDFAASNPLPLSYLSTAQQFDFAALAYDYGILIDPYEIDAYYFRFIESVVSGTGGGGAPLDSMLVVQLGFGPGAVRSSTLALRLPTAPATPGPPATPAAGERPRLNP